MTGSGRIAPEPHVHGGNFFLQQQRQLQQQQPTNIETQPVKSGQPLIEAEQVTNEHAPFNDHGEDDYDEGAPCSDAMLLRQAHSVSARAQGVLVPWSSQMAEKRRRAQRAILARTMRDR